MHQDESVTQHLPLKHIVELRTSAALGALHHDRGVPIDPGAAR
jgi:hypothetical protein